MNRAANTKRAEWPSPDELCRRLRAPEGHAYLHSLLEHIHDQQDLAYDCLRRARWGEEPEAQVLCPECENRAWSHSSSKGGKHRWRCVSKKMYAKQQRTKGYKSKGRSQHGCGYRFTDTTGTPFDQCSIPLGFVFLALYLPTRERDMMMASLDDTVTATKLRDVLEALRQQEHTQLLKGMRRSAGRFCDAILMTTKSTPTPKNESGSRSRPPVNPAGQKTSVSDLVPLDARIQSLQDMVTLQAKTLQRLMNLQRKRGPRHTLLTKATVSSRKAASRQKRGAKR